MERKIQNKEKLCRDCVHFIQYYRKDSICFRAVIGCGFCTNRLSNGHKRKTNQICECFTETDLGKINERQCESIKELLFSMNDKLQKLQEVLTDDEIFLDGHARIKENG